LLGIQRAQFLVRLPRGIDVDAGWRLDTAIARTAAGRIRGMRDGWAGGPWRVARGIRVFQPLGISAPVAFQLHIDPVDRGAIAVRPLPTITESRQSFDRRLVLAEIEPSYEDLDGIESGGRGGCLRDCDGEQQAARGRRCSESNRH